MIRIFLALLLLFGCPIFASAQKIRTIKGEYTYYPPENVTLEQAKQIAVERARIEAIAREFGTNVSQTNTVAISSDNLASETSFSAIAQTEVKGDWIADVKDPEVEIDYGAGMLVVTARVEGKVRARNAATVDLALATLCNGVESEKFQNNDKFSVRFKAAAKGYLSIWLMDDALKQAYCLLPYDNANGMAREVFGKREYMLLSTQDPLYPYQEETILTTDKDVDFNRLVLVFSTQTFSMPLTDQGEFLPELSTANFEKWLQRNRIKDEAMFTIQRTLEIRK